MPRRSAPAALVNKLFRLPLLEKLLASTPLRRSPFRDLIVRKIAPKHWDYKKATRRMAERGGIVYELDLRQHLDHGIYFGSTDPAKETLYREVQEGDTVLDIGSNLGEVLLNFARRTGKNGRVYGFEPHPVTFNKLKRNVELNPFSCISLFNLGLSDRKGSFSMAVPDERNTGMNRILPEGEAPGSLRVDTEKLDDFVLAQELDRVDLIKIDVEGFELFVLRGGEATLRRFRPRLFIELVDDNLKAHGFRARDIIAFLTPYGYQIRSAQTGAAITADTDLDHCQFDIWCVPS
ncbi:FkbM family methyltransferase [Compostibacter hankyongensis]|uniref:Methyltransferase FkbM domain-containing protein n=1 Tax=Compostibacter hankyongensis TaxID=1007089 RepID=A0ABP8G6R7_9BACT